MNDVILVGGGVNSLVTATLLARAGLKVLVLERGDRVGGCARTDEIAPGFRCPTLAHSAAIDPVNSDKDYAQLFTEINKARRGRHFFNPGSSLLPPG